MFSFHKPKIYRSISGCCICKAKSSSSRFTDSKKYETEFEKCFKINEKRSGEICNACVLLVKRWKKLPPGTQRDWHHVVDARAGPGTKSIKAAKFNTTTTSSITANQLNKKHTKPKKHKAIGSNDFSDDVLENFRESPLLSGQFHSPNESDFSDFDENMDDEEDEEDEDELYDNFNETNTKRKRNQVARKVRRRVDDNKINGSNEIEKRNNKLNANANISSFLDMTFWRKEKICCGVIFKGPDNEVLIYPKLLRPCSCRQNAMKTKSNKECSDNRSITSSSAMEEDSNSSGGSVNNLTVI